MFHLLLWGSRAACRTKSQEETKRLRKKHMLEERDGCDYGNNYPSQPDGISSNHSGTRERIPHGYVDRCKTLDRMIPKISSGQNRNQNFL